MGARKSTRTKSEKSKNKNKDEMNAYEYADNISMYSFPSGSHTLYSTGIRYAEQVNSLTGVTHLAPRARSKTTGRG